MNNPDTELVFPLRVIPLLVNMHDMDWKDLVQFVHSNEVGSINQLGFVLMMVKLAGCSSCNSDSFRAMRGCTQCAVQTIRRQHISGLELRDIFEQNRVEVDHYLSIKKSNSA